MGKRPLLVTTILIIGFVFTVVIFRALSNTLKGPAATTPVDETTSTQKIYFQANPVVQSVPNKTVSDPNYPGVSIYWIKQSVADGNDTCTLYDNATKQIYANRYRNDGQYSGAKSGWMFYDNNLINKDKAASFLDSTCFKN